MNRETLVLYHSNCADGMGAAWAAHKFLGDKATYIACGYEDVKNGELPGGRPLSNITQSTIYFLDYSAPREVLENLAKENHVVVIDHHKTAKAALEGILSAIDGLRNTDLPGLYAWFDMNRSGAAMAWAFFFEGIVQPKLIRYIEDRDLWKWELPYTKEISAFIRTWEWSIERFEDLCVLLEDNRGFNAAATAGEAVLRSDTQAINAIMGFAKVYDTIFGKVALCPATYYWSELGNELLKKFPEAKWSLSYYRNENTGDYKFSARSIGDFDVSKIAAHWGGGGHKNAAGFTLESRVAETILERFRYVKDSRP